MFHTVLPAQPPEQPGGWKVACVNITFFDLGRPGVSWVCDTEVGVPEISGKGPVSDRVAQVKAAAAADTAAREVLGKGGPYIAATACIDFITIMNLLFRTVVPGGKVNKFKLCLVHGIQPEHFP